MKNYLFFDTETTGLPTNYKSPPGSDWPEIVTISWIISDSKKFEYYNFLIKPEGWVISKDAEKIHGISQDHAEKNGIPLILALEEFLKSYNYCDAIVAHNIAFDLTVLKSAFIFKNIPVYLSKKTYCTMLLGTDLCCLPSKYSFQTYKWPRLEELHFHLFGQNFDGAHNSETDSLICAKCFFKIIEKKDSNFN